MASSFEEIVAYVHEKLAMPGLPYGVFRLAQAQRDAVRRVVWIPLQFETLGIPATNPRYQHNAGGSTTRRTAMYQEQWTVECHIVGDTMEDAEAIRERVLWAVREVFGPQSKPLGGMWVTQGEGDASVMHGHAQKVVQRFQWSLAALAPETAEVVIVGVDGPEIPP